MANLLRSLARLAFRRGVGAGGRHWMALGVLTWLAARARDKASEPPKVLHREELESLTDAIVDRDH